MTKDYNDELTNGFDFLGFILMFVSGAGLMFLFYMATNAFFAEFVVENENTIFLKALAYAFEFALVVSFVRIHRSGVGALANFKNPAHFFTILIILYVTFMIETNSIANAVQYVKANFIKEEKLAYTRGPIYQRAKEVYENSKKELKKWKSYKGTEAERAMIENLKIDIKNAKAEKARRLRMYKYATTKKADSIIQRSMKKLQEIEISIRELKENKTGELNRKIDMALQKMEDIRVGYKKEKSKELLKFSKTSKETAEKIVMIIALAYFVHGILLTVTKEGFTLSGWLSSIFPFIRESENQTDQKQEVRKIVVAPQSTSKPKERIGTKEAIEMGKMAAAFDPEERVTKSRLAEVLGVGETTALSRLEKYADMGVFRKEAGKYFYKGDKDENTPPTPFEIAA